LDEYDFPVELILTEEFIRTINKDVSTYILETTKVTILRDSGSLQTLIRGGVAAGEETGKFVALGSLYGRGSVPLFKLHLNSECFCGPATVAVLPELPVQGVDLILGNDLAGSKMRESFLPRVLQERPGASADLQQLEAEMPHVFPLCAVTCSMTATRRALETLSAHNEAEETLGEEDYNISNLFDPAIPCFQSLTGATVQREGP